MDVPFASSETTSSCLLSIEESRWYASEVTLRRNTFRESNDERSKCLLKALGIASASYIRALKNIKEDFKTFGMHSDALRCQSSVLLNALEALKKMIIYYGGNFSSLVASEDNEAAFNDKFEWVTKHSSSANPASVYLVVQAAVEGILSIRFMFALCEFEEDHPELTEWLDLLIQERFLLRDLICSMFRDVEAAAKPKEAQIWHLVKEAVDLEKEFFDSVILPLFPHYSEFLGVHRFIDEECKNLLEKLGLTGTRKLRKPIQVPEVEPDLHLKCEGVNTALLESGRDAATSGASKSASGSETPKAKDGERKKGGLAQSVKDSKD